MKLTAHTITTDVSRPLTVIVASDLHDRNDGDSLTKIRLAKPDLILCPGDMTEDALGRDIAQTKGFLFMKKAAALAPLYYSLGNHEHGISKSNRKLLRNAGIRLLDNDSVTLHNGIHIGGLTSGFVCSIRKTGKYAPGEPSVSFLKKFDRLEGTKILLCHHPEYYETYLKDTSIDVIVSGHAHGGQWRFFGSGILAPGQGLFPKYCRGVHENRLSVSCGMSNTVPIPRFFNPKELVLLTLLPQNKETQS